MATEATATDFPGWDQPALPAFWTNDLPTAHATLLRLATTAGVALQPLTKAIDHTIEAHRHQFRKGTDAPYAVHPIRIACTLIDSFGVTDAEILCAALLHDVLEETRTTRDMLEKDHGARCADLVAVLSRLPGDERPAGGDIPESAYLQRIWRYGDAAILIKVADKIDNVRDATSHPDKHRAGVFVNETFRTYVPLGRALTDRSQARRAERLLLEATGRTGGVHNPNFLKALLATVSRCLETDHDFSEVPFPAVAAAVYCFVNPEARSWLEFDGIAITHENLMPHDLALRMASTLRRKFGGPELPRLLELAGIPPSFAAGSNEPLWRRAGAFLARLQRLLASKDTPPWLSTLLRPDHEPLLMALVQSSIYLPASWRCPLWSMDLGAVLSQRIQEISDGAAATLPSFALAHRLALSRYADGTGTRRRAARVFEHDAGKTFPAAGLWALRIGIETLQSDAGRNDAIHNLWQEVHSRNFEERSLPERPGAIPAADVETIGLRETKSLFAEARLETQFSALISALTRDSFEGTKWIVFDHDEWLKRRARWSQPGQLSLDAGVALGDLESRGARVIRRCFGDTELLTALPARKFAIQDRLPELSADDLKTIDGKRYTAVAIFDTMISNTSRALWIPRVYRILDTIEDLDPDSVQALTIDYEGAGEAIPRLRAFLPLPAGEEEAEGQKERKRLLARYVVAQIYSCGVVRRVRRAHLSCAAVAESRRKHAFSDSELREALANAEREQGLRAAFGSYIERYAFEPFGVTAGNSDHTGLPFGADEMRRGTYVGIDIGGQRVKIAVAQAGQLLGNAQRREIGTPQNVTVSEFCRQILGHVSRELEDVSVRWDSVDAIGISWPGAVRDNHIVGMSRVLQALTHDGQSFSPTDPIDRLGSFDFLGIFAAVARETSALKDDLAFSILNDGDAEAFGNHALRTLKGLGKPGGKIFVKLGTSLAGGRVTAGGSVAEDVAEYSKIFLRLPTANSSVLWPNLARYYISAEGVRNLSRTFSFGGALLFGEREGANRDEHLETRIEPVELGQLLPLFAGSEDASSFLAHLVDTDDRPSADRIERAVAATAAALEHENRAALLDYIRQRGMDLGRPWSGWPAGLRRTLWLCTGSDVDVPDAESILPENFPYERLARTIAGTVALFSKLGLHVTHLIAQLYNIYRRGTFSEVVLAGGVLSGRSGEIVEAQAKGFLRKYYDKIYGDGKPLGPDTLVRAGFDNVSNPGVFGAAMAASRQWHVEHDRLLGRRIDERLRHLPIGAEVEIEELFAASDDVSSSDRALRLLELRLATGVIARTPGGRIQKVS